MVCSGLATFMFWERQMWLGFAVALFVHGSFGTFVAGAAVHELGHGTVFRSRWLNQLFLYLFSLLAWWNPFDYGLSHTCHHGYTLHPEGDREVLLPLPRASGFIFLITVVHHYALRPSRADIRPRRLGDRRRYHREGGARHTRPDRYASPRVAAGVASGSVR